MEPYLSNLHAFGIGCGVV